MSINDIIPPTQTRVFLAVCRIHQAKGRVVMDDLVNELGLSRSNIHARLTILRRRGLVTWEHGTQGTLRPLLEIARKGPIDDG